jgi:hypothetical protein
MTKFTRGCTVERFPMLVPIGNFYYTKDLTGFTVTHVDHVSCVDNDLGQERLCGNPLGLVLDNLYLIFVQPTQLINETVNRLIHFKYRNNGRIFKRGFVRAKVIHKFLNFDAGFFFGVGHGFSRFVSGLAGINQVYG